MLKKLFFFFIVRPIVLLISGVYLRGKEHLPLEGPCIIAANHNSHIDTMVLMSIFPLKKINKIRPVAAADYFLKNKFISWFSLNIIGIIPLSRKLSRSEGHPFDKVDKALKNGDIVIIFPEGSRGNGEEVSSFKTGIAHLAKNFPQAPVLPVYIRGAGKCLPKGEALFVPFVIDVCLSAPITIAKEESNKDFTLRLEEKIKYMEKELV